MYVKILTCSPAIYGHISPLRWGVLQMTSLRSYSLTGMPGVSQFPPKDKKQSSFQFLVSDTCGANFCRHASQKAQKSHQVMEAKQQGEVTMGQKVAQAGKDVSYTFVFLGGLTITAVMFYAIGRELFSGQSPAGVHTSAYKLCAKNEDLQLSIGEPMKSYGEMTKRGRRRHVRHTVFDVNGVKHMRLQFYLEGPHHKGTAQAEVQQNESGKYEFRYLFVEIDSMPRQTVVVVDNR